MTVSPTTPSSTNISNVMHLRTGNGGDTTSVNSGGSPLAGSKGNGHADTPEDRGAKHEAQMRMALDKQLN
jgi:hypothetical protein